MKNNYEIYSGLGIPFRDKHAFTQEAMNNIDIDEESAMYRDLLRQKLKRKQQTIKILMNQSIRRRACLQR